MGLTLFPPEEDIIYSSDIPRLELISDPLEYVYLDAAIPEPEEKTLRSRVSEYSFYFYPVKKENADEFIRLMHLYRGEPFMLVSYSHNLDGIIIDNEVVQRHPDCYEITFSMEVVKEYPVETEFVPPYNTL